MKESTSGSAVRLIEESLMLAKRLDAAAWLVYLVGVVPFFGLLLFEITDIAQSPFALEQLPTTAFALAALYFWLHICQSVFCGRVQATLTETEHALSSQFKRAFATQCVLAGSKLLIWPAAVVLLVPYPAVTMFYQHALIPPEPCRARSSWRCAWAESKRDALYRQPQALWMLLVVLLLRIILAVNLWVLLHVLPSLWKTFTGAEGMLTRAPQTLENPTSLAAVCVLAYIGFDPIVKAACVLRRFTRGSETSGFDLRLRLSSLERAAAAATIFLLLCLPVHHAAAAPPPAPHSTISPQQMRQAIETIFHDRRSVWDLPLPQARKPASNPVTAFIDTALQRIDSVWQSILSSLDNILRALRHILSNREAGHEQKHAVSRVNGWLVLGFCSLLVCAAVLAAFWNRRKQIGAQSDAVTPVSANALDIAQEDVDPTDQPEHEWLALAGQHRAAGNLRFAMRALYLYTLAGLGRTGLISLARGKSNLDYVREVERRARRLHPEFAPAFHSNVNLFEQSWYGTHPVTEEVLAQFDNNSSRLRDSL